MTYATALDLLDRFDAEEIAQRADRVLPRRVSGALLQAVAASADLSAYQAEDVAQAAVAMTRVQRALNDARDTINSYICARYTLPIDPVPDVLSRIACELARFYLYDDTVTEVVKDRHTAALKLLGDVRDGRALLGPDNASNAQPAQPNSSVSMVTGGKVWQREKSGGFI